MNITALDIAGFRTLPHYKDGVRDGFIIQSVRNPKTAEECPLIARVDAQGIRAVSETFDDEGAGILKESLEAGTDIILMDELGFLESSAFNFQMYVNKCLDSDIPVFGVVRLMDTPFLNSVRNREDIRVIEVTAENYQEASSSLNTIMRDILKNIRLDT